jgi:hypothetical protein
VKVKISIDSVVLTGFGRDDPTGFTEGLQHELSRLVKENGVGHITNMHVLDAGIVRLDRSSNANLAGKQTARSIYRSIGKK